CEASVMKTLARYALLCASILLYGWLFCIDFSSDSPDVEEAPSSLWDGSKYETAPYLEEGPKECAMHSCFDFTKCTSKLKVFVYPDVEEIPPSEVYRKILTAFRESQYAVSDPADACLFVVSVDTIDRDKIR
ncbi:hypothetical protein COOONC_18055, partial [Cooperia oncophora]